MGVATLSNQPDALVKVTIPADLVSKTRPDEHTIRWMIDNAFRVCLGRSNWKEPIIIIGTVEQFGVFAYLLCEKNLQVLLGQIRVEMFIPQVATSAHVYDASKATPKTLQLPKKIVPPAFEVPS